MLILKQYFFTAEIQLHWYFVVKHKLFTGLQGNNMILALFQRISCDGHSGEQKESRNKIHLSS